MMPRLRAALVLAGLALGMGAADARAQTLGMPVDNSGVPSGLALYGDVSFPNDAAGGGTAYGGTAKLGFSNIGITASLSRYNPSGDIPDTGDDVTSVGGTGNFRLIGGPLVPFSVTLQAGAGYWKRTLAALESGQPSDLTVWHVPVGIGFGLNIPSSAFSLRPWVAPRLDLVHTTTENVAIGSVGETASSFAVSAGLELNLLSGLGLQAAYDWTSETGHAQALGVGAHYAFRVPGL